MDSDSFLLKWSDHQSTVIQSFELLRSEKEFYDVTLVSDDQLTFSAHKLVLSACSIFFRNILKSNVHSHPLLYLHGIKAEDLKQVLDFIYLGCVNVMKDDLDKFLELSNKLEVKGVMLIESENQNSDDVDNPLSLNDATEVNAENEIMSSKELEQNHNLIAEDHSQIQKTEHPFLDLEGGQFNSAKRIKTESVASSINVMNQEMYGKSYDVVYQARDQVKSDGMRKEKENMTFLQLRSQISEDSDDGIRKQAKTHPAAEQINFIQVSNQINENIVINHNTANQNQQVINHEETLSQSMVTTSQSKTRSLSPNLQGPVFQCEDSYDEHMQTTSTGFRCNFCYKETPRRWHMKNHIEIHLNNVYTCEICGIELRTRNAYKKHQAAKHKVQNYHI